MLVLASISETLVNETAHLVREGGLPAIFLLMLAESACIPIPSEATMLFAGFAVADPGASAAQHHLTLARSGDRRRAGQPRRLLDRLRRRTRGAPGADRTARPLAAHEAELTSRNGRTAGSQRYGAAAVFFSRMLPIVRTFISLPAGVAKMPFWRFTVFTLAGLRAVGARARARRRSGGQQLEGRAQRLRVRRLRDRRPRRDRRVVYAVVRRGGRRQPATDAAG